MACAAFTPSWLRPAGVLSDVHRELREGHLDAARIEGELHPLEELALYVPLLDRWYHLEPESASSSDRKSTRLNSSHTVISYAVFCLKKKKNTAINILDAMSEH